MTRAKFEDLCYEAYKLEWMISHGHTLRDYLNGLIYEAEDALDADAYLNGDIRNKMETFDALFEYQNGFEGSIWVSKSEFLKTEFGNVDYITHLISLMPNSKEIEAWWRKEYKICYYPPQISVSTSAGVLNAYELTDPGQPGICICLQPTAYEDEIDVAMASVYEDSDLATNDGERPEDVVIHAYGDATTEDYTIKEIIRREDVIAGLGTVAHE